MIAIRQVDGNKNSLHVAGSSFRLPFIVYFVNSANASRLIIAASV